MNRELEYKAAVLGRILSRKLIGEQDVAISEIPINNYSRRVDLVVVNGKLHAFEIKTEADSLVRLQGQVSSYLRFFDKVTVVCAERHEEKVLASTPREVEVWVMVGGSGRKLSDHLRIARRGRACEICDPASLWTFIPKRVIASFLRRRGFAANESMLRDELCRVGERLPRVIRREFALAFLKNRYKKRWQRFLESVSGGSPSADDVLALRAELPQAAVENESDVVNESYLDRLLRRYGVDVSHKLRAYGYKPKQPVLVLPVNRRREKVV